MLSSVREPLSMYSGREKPAAYGLLPITKLLPTYLGPCANVNCVYPCGLWSFPLFNVAAKVERSGPTLMYSGRENASSAFFAGRHTGPGSCIDDRERGDSAGRESSTIFTTNCRWFVESSLNCNPHAMQAAASSDEGLLLGPGWLPMASHWEPSSTCEGKTHQRPSSSQGPPSGVQLPLSTLTPNSAAGRQVQRPLSARTPTSAAGRRSDTRQRRRPSSRCIAVCQAARTATRGICGHTTLLSPRAPPLGKPPPRSSCRRQTARLCLQRGACPFRRRPCSALHLDKAGFEDESTPYRGSPR